MRKPSNPLEKALLLFLAVDVVSGAVAAAQSLPGHNRKLPNIRADTTESEKINPDPMRYQDWMYKEKQARQRFSHIPADTVYNHFRHGFSGLAYLYDHVCLEGSNFRNVIDNFGRVPVSSYNHFFSRADSLLVAKGKGISPINPDSAKAQLRRFLNEQTKKKDRFK